MVWQWQGNYTTAQSVKCYVTIWYDSGKEITLQLKMLCNNMVWQWQGNYTAAQSVKCYVTIWYDSGKEITLQLKIM